MRKERVSRRGFLARSLVGVAAVQIVPRYVLGGPGHTAPSEMITSANIGMGGPAQNVKCDRLLAICDVRRDKLRGGMPGEKPTDGVDCYLDFRQILERDDIDAISVGSTETWHAIQIVQSMKAGKDVYGEKPMSMTIREAAAIRDTAKDAAYQTEFLCHSSEIAQTLGRPLKWDPLKEEFIGDEEANKLTSRIYRSPWRL